MKANEYEESWIDDEKGRYERILKCQCCGKILITYTSDTHINKTENFPNGPVLLCRLCNSKWRNL